MVNIPLFTRFYTSKRWLFTREILPQQQCTFGPSPKKRKNASPTSEKVEKASSPANTRNGMRETVGKKKPYEFQGEVFKGEVVGGLKHPFWKKI